MKIKGDDIYISSFAGGLNFNSSWSTSFTQVALDFDSRL